MSNSKPTTTASSPNGLASLWEAYIFQLRKRPILTKVRNCKYLLAAATAESTHHTTLTFFIIIIIIIIDNSTS
jgi:hypothetical protein